MTTPKQFERSRKEFDGSKYVGRSTQLNLKKCYNKTINLLQELVEVKKLAAS